jgi:hypothetical protein
VTTTATLRIITRTSIFILLLQGRSSAHDNEAQHVLLEGEGLRNQKLDARDLTA